MKFKMQTKVNKGTGFQLNYISKYQQHNTDHYQEADQKQKLSSVSSQAFSLLSSQLKQFISKSQINPKLKQMLTVALR